MGYQVRTMRRSDLDIAVGWAAGESWNPGRRDADAFWAADPEGFLIGELDGTPIACISVVDYPPSYGFLGFYIVRPEFRGHGHGIAIWRAGLARLAGRTVGLDGVVDQQENYRKSGFVLAWNNARWRLERPVEAAGGTLDATTLPFPALLAYDSRHFGATRAAFLSAWLALPGTVARAVVIDGAIRGYGVVRPSQQGFKIGPLFAEDEAVAARIFADLAAAAAPGPVFLDVPAPNRAAQDLVRRHAMTPVFETARMYLGPAPAIDSARVYGVTSYELG